MPLYRAVLLVFLKFCFLDEIPGLTSTGNIEVTLGIFSGRKDPKWSITPTDRNLKTIQALLDKAEKSKPFPLVYSPDDMPARLGYRGFLLEYNNQEELILGPKTVPLQLALFQTMPNGTIPEKIVPRTLKVIKAGTVLPKLKRAVGKRYSPPFDIVPWTADPVKQNNNCYNYANIRITNSFAQPGRGSGQQYTSMTAAAVQDASIRDGLQVSPNSNVPPRTRHVVALVVEDGVDFHWYRRDNDGKWSHKPGPTSVTRTDESGNLITDPKTCDMNGYRFVCFMTSDRNTVNIS